MLITVQAVLADHHREFRAVALTEANVVASGAYVMLVGALSLAAAIGAGWRAALLASFAVPLIAVRCATATWRSRRRGRARARPAGCPARSTSPRR